MAVKTQVPLVMMVFVLCVSAGASTASLDDTLVADDVGLFAYPPSLSLTGLDDTLMVDEVAQYATAPAPSPTDEAAQYASTPAPSGGLQDAFLHADDAGLYASAPAPISSGLDDTLLVVEAAQLDEVALSATAPSPSTGLEDAQPLQADEVGAAAAPLSPLLLDDSSNKADSVSEIDSIQKIIDIEGCIYEIITFSNYNMGEEENKVGPACCKAVEDVVKSKKWPNIFPFNPAFPSKIKGYCAQYAGSPSSAPTTSYAPAPAPAEGPAYVPDQGDWMY